MQPKFLQFASSREEDGQVIFTVPLDDLTVARLMTIADLSHADPAIIIASIVHDVLEDDEHSHLLEEQSEPLH